VKLRFNIQDAVYNSVTPSFCQPTIQSDYDSISGNITINEVSVIDFTDLSTGVFTHAPFPIDANGINVLGVTLENSLYVAVEIEIPNLWDSTEVVITLNKTDYKTLTRRFTVFGYDIGKNPNIPITSVNPDMYLVMIPETYPVTFATTGPIFQPPLSGSWSTATGTENITLTADFPGVNGNSITLAVGNAVTPLSVFVTNWNAANPTNTVTLTETDGTGYVPGAGESFVLTGGTNAPITEILAYANFVGWRKPFTNDLHLYANYSEINDNAEYKDTSNVLLAPTHIAILPCYNGDPINLVSTQTTIDHCGTPMIIDTCTFGALTISQLSLIPTYSCGVTCADCCSEDSCLVYFGTNYAQFILDVANITPLNNSDVAIVSTETITLRATVYNGCGNYVSENSLVISLNPLPSLSGSQVPITFPSEGDYAVTCEISTDAFKCTHTEVFKGCSFYDLKKDECNKYTITNLASSDLTLDVESLDKDGNWILVISNEIIAPCGTYQITLADDGVYRIAPKVLALTEYYIAVVDCAMKACFVDYTKKRVCQPKVDCGCSGNCNDSQVVVPTDLYDFSAFSILVYNYFALLNDLYVKNFIYNIFTPSDIDTLLTITQYLERIKEYCSDCNTTTVDTNSGDCGCS
jgi:hypothetical protein